MSIKSKGNIRDIKGIVRGGGMERMIWREQTTNLEKVHKKSQEH